MILKTSKLDVTPIATKLVDNFGLATQSLAFFLTKVIKRLSVNEENFKTIETQLNQGITQNIVVMVTSTTSKTLVFKDGLLTEIL
jgi:hypothetical protein